MSIGEECDRAHKGTFPGPSRTVTVEPIQVPTAPAVTPTVPPEPLPEPQEPEPPREPSPVP